MTDRYKHRIAVPRQTMLDVAKLLLEAHVELPMPHIAASPLDMARSRLELALQHAERIHDDAILSAAPLRTPPVPSADVDPGSEEEA